MTMSDQVRSDCQQEREGSSGDGADKASSCAPGDDSRSSPSEHVNTDSPQVSRSRGLRWKVALAAFVVLSMAVAVYSYWEYSSLHPSTSDAYVGANVVRIAPLVSGCVAKVNVRAYQRVHAGDVLVELDKRPLQALVNGAEARLVLARQQAAALEAAIKTAEAKLSEARAQLVDAQRQTRRIRILASKGDASKAQRDDAAASLKTAKAGVAAAVAVEREARQNLGAAGDANANVKAAEAAVATAKIDLEHATIAAPVNGIVGEVNTRPGSVVATGTALFPLVDTHHWWVDANFKETELERIKPGQPARITLDFYGAKEFHGFVEAISPASGAAFSLLPPENATGNWVKVTQRIPVRIRLEIGSEISPLHIGASASVRIDTTTKTASERS
jgi:membrane fusion protein, multidrug efflux system